MSRSHLQKLGDEFVAALTRTASAFIGADSPFHATSIGDGTKIEVTSAEPLLVTVGSEVLFAVVSTHHCTVDTSKDFLRVAQSSIKVFAGRRAVGDPLFRYDYENPGSSDLPCAHLQIHAHRDQMTAAMSWAARHRAKRRKKSALKYPQPATLSELHFPLGGHRFRPGLEDVLQMLAEEFGADTGPEWPAVRDAAREDYRRAQTAAAVRDCPTAAAEALTSLGFTVTPPAGHAADDRPDRLRAF